MVMITVIIIKNYCKISSKCNSNNYNNVGDIGNRDNQKYGKKW